MYTYTIIHAYTLERSMKSQLFAELKLQNYVIRFAEKDQEKKGSILLYNVEISSRPYALIYVTWVDSGPSWPAAYCLGCQMASCLWFVAGDIYINDQKSAFSYHLVHLGCQVSSPQPQPGWGRFRLWSPLRIKNPFKLQLHNPNCALCPQEWATYFKALILIYS